MSHFAIPPDQIGDLQRVGLEMALYFDAFCKKHDLTYYFCGGCCIGALRTGGFIPWDDDVDVFMPRRDYERLAQLWKDTDVYELMANTQAVCCRRPFMTIHNKNTTFIQTLRKDCDLSHGVALDILPLDGCPTGWRRKAQKLWALAYSLFVVGWAPTNHGKAVNLLGRVGLALVPEGKLRYKLWRYCEKKMTQYPIEQCDYITELCSGPHYMQNEYPREAFDQVKLVSFEGHEFPIPAGYDAYLKLAFGDYMSLPPKEKQVCHHEYEFMDMHNGYARYKGIYYCVPKK